MQLQESVARWERIQQKGFLGPSLKEDMTLPSVGLRAARSAGVEVEDGRMRCPDGSPGAGNFTDLQMSNCQVQNVSGKKTALTPEIMEFKIGLFNTRTRLGHTFQAAGTSLLPGDSSRLRSPVRSAVRRGLTPGGGGDRKLGRRLAEPAIFRCPSGYENGGRFGSGLQSCGRRLFTPAEGINLPGKRTVVPNGTATRFRPGKPGDGGTRIIKGRRGTNNAADISRNVDLAEVGGEDQDKRSASLLSAIRAVRKDESRSYLIRKDGVALKPSASMSTLAKQKRNRDMDGGTIVAFGKKSSFGKTELPILINSPAKSLAIVLPGDGYVLISKTRKLTTPEKNAVNAVMSASGPEKVMELGKASGGALRVSVEGVRDARKTVRIRPAGGGASREVPIWVYNTYLQRSATGRDGRDIWVIVKDA